MIDEDDQAMYDKRIAGMDYLKRKKLCHRRRYACPRPLASDSLEKDARIKELEDENSALKSSLAATQAVHAWLWKST